MSGIRVELELDDGTFTTRMLHAGETVRQFNDNLGGTAVAMRQVEPHHQNFIGKLRDVVVVIAAARLAIDNIRTVTTGWAGDIIKVNAEFERLQILLKGMSKSSDPLKEATDQVRQLRDFAKDAPFSVKALADTFVKLKSTGVDPMNGSLKSLVDSVAAFGGNEEALHRVTIAIQQMSGKGVIQMEELRQQLGEHIPRAVELMARSIGLSTGQLIQTVSKGTLDAKKTLEVFQLELDRTFGGAAHAQMQTFNGQLSQMKTNFQNLALDVGGAGFFEAVKTQFKELNQFLSGNAAQVFARDLGSALTSAIGYIRKALDWIVEFRDGLLRLGEALVVVFGTNLVLHAGGTFIGMMRSMVTATTALRLEWQTLNTAFQINSIGAAIGSLGIAGVGLSRTTAIVRGLGIAMTALGAGIGFLGSVVLPITAVVLGLAWAFGFFEDKINDAYNAVVKYGAADEAQLELAKKKVDLLREQADLAQRVAEQSSKGGVIFGLGSEYSAPVSQDELNKDAKEKAEKAQEGSDIIAKRSRELKKRAQQEAVRDELAFLADLREKRSKTYDEEEKQLGEAYAADLKLLQDKHKDTAKLTSEYQAGQRERSLAFYQAEYDDLERSIQNQHNLSNYDAQTKEALEAALLAKQVEIQKQRNRLAEIPLGAQTLNKGDDLQKAITKATQMLVKVNAEIENSRATLKGADGELAQFIATLQDPTNKSFFPRENEELQKLIKALIEAKTLSEGLKDQVAGQTQLARDLEEANRKAKEENFDLKLPKGQDLTALDKVLLKIQGGFYDGKKPLARLLGEDIGKEAKEAATSLNAALGDETQSKGEKLAAVISTLTNAWATFAGTVNGTSLDAKLTSAADLVKGWSNLSNPSKLTPEQKRSAEDTARIDQENRDLKDQKKVSDYLDTLKGKYEASSESAGKFDATVRSLTRSIVAGDLVASDRNPLSDRYKSAYEWALKVDAAEEARSKRNKLIGKLEGIEAGKESEMEELIVREEDLARRFEAASKNRLPRETFRKESQFDKQDVAIRQGGAQGLISPAVMARQLAETADLKRRWLDVEVGDLIQKEQIKNQEIQKSLLSADDARKYSFDLEMKRLNELQAMTSLSADNRARIEQVLAQKIDLYRRKLLADSPIGKMVKEWSDFGNNLQTAAVGWMNSFTDNLANMVAKGKYDFKSLADSIIADILRIAIRAAIVRPLMNAFGLGGSLFTGSSDVSGYNGANSEVGFSIPGLRAGRAHTGGTVGNVPGPKSMYPASMFMGAPRFHIGGFPGLTPGEVPIIAKQGEVIGWPDQMARAFGGGQSQQTNTFHVTVNGSSGSSEQNDDLVRKMSVALQAQAKALVADGIRQQMRPGGMLRA